MRSGHGTGIGSLDRNRHHPAPPLSGLSEGSGKMREVAKEAEEKESQMLMNRLMGDIDPELLAFLRAQVDSFAKWDLIHFFYENPHTTDTASSIALYVGRNPTNTEAELDELVTRGILVSHRLGEMKVYSLSPDPVIWERIRQFIRACGDREFRIKAIYHVIRGLR